MSKPGFIKFYNCFMEEGEYKLSPQEWYFYSLLAARWSPFLNGTEITVSMLAEIQSVYNDSKASRNCKNTWEQVKGLADKGVITINVEGIEAEGKADYSKVMRTVFNDFVGHEQISRGIYDLSTDPIELYFLSILERFESRGGFSKTMDGLAKLFECNEKTAQKAINAMLEKKLISYEQGKSTQIENGQFKRSPNKYHLFNEQPVEAALKPKEEEKVSSTPIIQELKEVSKTKPVGQWGNWEYGANLTEADYDLYVINKENSEFMKIANVKIDRISYKGKKTNVTIKVETEIKAAEERLMQKQRRQEERKRLSDSIQSPTKMPKFRSKPSVINITDYLD